MSTSFQQGFRRLSGRALKVLLASACLPLCLAAQIPSVLPTSVTAVPHNETYSNPWQTAISNRGDMVLLDFGTGGIYEYPANGGPEITIAPPNNPIGGFDDNGIAIDPRNNNLYVDDNYNDGLLLFPFDAATGKWDIPSQQVATNLSGDLGGTCGNYFQSAGLAINASGLMAVGTENGCGVSIFTVPIDASGNFGTAVSVVSVLTARARTLAIDNAGDISLTEDNGTPGVSFIPAGTTGLTTDKNLARVDPSLGNVQGVTSDGAGNLYIVDGSAGVVFVPMQSGTPNPAAAVTLTVANGSGGPAFDASRQILFYPTSGYANIKDLIALHLFTGDAGVVPVNTASVDNVTFNFTAATTPLNFVIQESNGKGDFTLPSDLTGCGIKSTSDGATPPKITTTGTPYVTGDSCTLAINFMPHEVGDMSASLLMEDAKGNVLSSTSLHGVGQSSQADVFPANGSIIVAGLKTPNQIAVDALGNLYVADSGQGKVLEFAPTGAAGVSIGTGLKAPTGVAVDAAGDVFIADSGSVLEVPNTASGLNAKAQSTVKSGLGTNLRLAMDSIGDLFVSDPDNLRIVQLRNVLGAASEFDIPTAATVTAIGVSGDGVLYAAAGPNLVQYSATGSNLTILSTVTGATGVAVDASGSVYVTQPGGTIRIPNENGVLTVADQVPVSPIATNPTSVAIDSLGNAYVTDGTSGDIVSSTASGFLNFGTLATPTSTANGTVSVVSAGNLPLNLSGFTGTPDFSVTTTTCIGAAVSVGSSCSAILTFNPGPGDQGNLSGAVAVQSDAVNLTTVDSVGVGAALAKTTTTLTQTTPPVAGDVAFTAKVVSTPTGGATPTGTVTVSVTGSDAAGVALITPIVATEPLVAGVASFALPQLEAGSFVFATTYNGDRVYGHATTPTTVSVAPGTVIMTQPAPSTVPQYVLSAGTGSSEPTDGTTVTLEYTYRPTITATSKNPLVGVPAYNGVQLSGVNYGAISYLIAGGTSPCGGSTAVNADGTSAFLTACLPIDTSDSATPDISTTYTLTPVYTSPDYGMVTGTPFTLIALRHPVVVLSSSVPTVSVTAGTPASATLTLTSLLGYGTAGADQTNVGANYTLPLALTCDGLPAYATCSFSYTNPDPSDPNSVDVLPGTPGSVVMTVNTNVPVGITAGLEGHSGTIALAILLNLGLFGFLLRKKRSLRQQLTAAFCLLVFCGVFACISGCGTAQTGTSPILTTPKGTYTVSVSAKQVGSTQIAGTTPGTTVTVDGSGDLESLPFSVQVTVQ